MYFIVRMIHTVETDKTVTNVASNMYSAICNPPLRFMLPANTANRGFLT